MLWLLDEDVLISDMPTFLDSQLVSFLLELSKFDMKWHEIHLTMKEINLRLKKHRVNTTIRSSKFLKQTNNAFALSENKLSLFVG